MASTRLPRAPHGPRVPDFFLIGVPRAATTSLYHALGRHPEVFVPALKEACFTCPDIDPEQRRTETRYFRDRADYLALFAAAGEDRLVGEGWTYNVYSPAAPGLIKALSPDARLLIQLRDPIEQMYSNHGLKLIMGDLAVDFERALDAQAAARGGRVDQPLNMRDYDLRDKAIVSPGLARFVDEFGRDRVHVTLHEEYAVRPDVVMRSIYRFLGIADQAAAQVEVMVPHREARWTGLNRAMASQRVIGAAKRLTPDALHPVARRLAAATFRRNRRRATRPPLDPPLQARLRDEFRTEVERLSEITGRDLVDLWWTRGSAPAA